VISPQPEGATAKSDAGDRPVATAPDSDAQPRKPGVGSANTAIIAVAAVLAAGITLYQLSRPGLLFGITPDISVWIGASIRLVHGAIPYRDFDLIQPPGFTLLATPFAALSEWIGTRDALAVLRLCTPLLSAGSVILVGTVIRHRGRGALIVACGVMAFFPAEMYALRSGLLESVVDFFCLAGLALIFAGDGFTSSRRRVMLGGVAFGIAGLVKSPAIVPVLVVAVLCLPEIRRRLAPFLVGVVAGFGIPTLPFFLLAPGSFIRDVLSPLSYIPVASRVPISARLGELTGVFAFGGSPVVAIAGTVVLVIVVAAAFVLAPRRKPSPLEWFAIGATVLAAVAQLGPAYYFPQYAAFMAPFLALLLGISIARLLAERSPVVALAIAMTGVTVLFISQLVAIPGVAAPDIADVVDAVIPAGACVLSDAPSKLVTTNRFVAAASGCNTMIDPQGATLSYGYGSAGAERLWTVQVEHADYMVTSTRFAIWDIPPDAALRAYVSANFQLVRGSGLLFYVRNGFSHGDAAGSAAG
jgi:alpha-1,2-mannosyltransferase